ncbi:hypothetical protein BH11PAT4_BH11PAT4_4650 [soil metagenome]
MHVTRRVALVLALALTTSIPSAGFAASLPRYSATFAAIDKPESPASQPGSPAATENYSGTFFETTLEGMLQRLNVTLSPLDRVTVFPDPSLGLGSHITIERTPTITIVDAGTTTQVKTWVTTVAYLAEEQRLELAAKDIVEPKLTAQVAHGTTVTVTRVAEVELLKREPIIFSVTKKNTVDLEKGQTETAVKGVSGEKEVTYLVKRVNGKEASRKVIKTEVTRPPVTEQVLVGIGPKLTKEGPHKDLINAAAKKYLINGTALHCLMMKESRGNVASGYPNAQYQGLFQYTTGFWATASAAAGFKGASITSAEAQIFATARALTDGQSGRWPPWSGCASL